jgi:hypothetical protein
MEWKVFNMVRTVGEGVVETVSCIASIADGDYLATARINQKVPYKSPAEPGFIPFDQLTEQQTIQWVQEQLGPDRLSQIEKGLQQTINEQKKQTVEGLPW